MFKISQTSKEEIWNAITHGLGVIFALAAMPFLIYDAYVVGGFSVTFGISVFGFGMLMCYLSSTLYHAVTHEKLKSRFLIWDHISIYLLIGGTYTPVVQKYTDANTGLIFLSIMWGIILVASILKIFYTGRYEKLSLILYLFLGWMAVFLADSLIQNMPLYVFWWILAGGIAYSIGVIFFIWERLPFNHSIWHLLVLCGTIFHFVAIYLSLYVE
ncbi:MAG: hemolysin III family protein [Saprospiraceae bacterium]